jgi:hypothetical protein
VLVGSRNLEQGERAAGIDGHSWAAEGRRQLFVWSGYTGSAASVDGCRLTYEAMGMPGGVCQPSCPAGACLSACREVGVDELYGPRPFADGGGTTLG